MIILGYIMIALLFVGVIAGFLDSLNQEFIRDFYERHEYED